LTDECLKYYTFDGNYADVKLDGAAYVANGRQFLIEQVDTNACIWEGCIDISSYGAYARVYDRGSPEPSTPDCSGTPVQSDLLLKLYIRLQVGTGAGALRYKFVPQQSGCTIYNCATNGHYFTARFTFTVLDGECVCPNVITGYTPFDGYYLGDDAYCSLFFPGHDLISFDTTLPGVSITMEDSRGRCNP
jgi:hypothetical protein